MGLFDLDDRLSWRQAAEFLGVSKSAFFRLVEKGEIPAHGVLEVGRFYLKSECRAYLQRVREARARKLRCRESVARQAKKT